MIDSSNKLLIDQVSDSYFLDQLTYLTMSVIYPMVRQEGRDLLIDLAIGDGLKLLKLRIPIMRRDENRIERKKKTKEKMDRLIVWGTIGRMICL